MPVSVMTVWSVGMVMRDLLMRVLVTMGFVEQAKVLMHMVAVTVVVHMIVAGRFVRVGMIVSLSRHQPYAERHEHGGRQHQPSKPLA